MRAATATVKQHTQAAAGAVRAEQVALLTQIEQRLRWLSSWTIHNANNLREKRDGLKVGGHQASCASITAVMNDRAILPRAAPSGQGGDQAPCRAGTARGPLPAGRANPREDRTFPRAWRLQREAFQRPGGTALEDWIENCPNADFAVLTYLSGAASNNLIGPDADGRLSFLQF